MLEKRESSSRPDRGVVTVETRGFNQRGEEVCYFRRKVMVPKRDAAPPRVRPVHVARRRLRPRPAPGGDGCLFCSIVAGRSRRDSCSTPPDVVAFLDHRPLFPGHTLVVPRAHVETLRDLDDATRDELFAQVQRVAAAVQDATGSAGLVRGHEQRGEPERARTSTCTPCPATARTASGASSGPGPRYADAAEAAAVAESIRVALGATM